MAGTRRFRFLDLFCGGGGSTCGARLAGAIPAAGVDLWDLATKTYSLNNPSARAYTGPLEDLDPCAIAKETGKIDLLLASPECTNHSPAKGAGKRCEASRAKAFQVVRYAKAFKPRWIVIENVVQMGIWQRFADLIGQIEGLGYQTTSMTLDASDFGVPQSRRRLFVACDLEGKPRAPRKQPGRKPSIGEILHPGPERGKRWPRSRLYAAGRARQTLTRATRAFRMLGRTTPFLLVYYGSDGAGGWQSLDRPLRTITTLDRFALVEPEGDRCYHLRMLQPPELAAAMGFPDDYKWPESTRRDRIRLIGNAVCPPVMAAVVRALMAQDI